MSSIIREIVVAVAITIEALLLSSCVKDDSLHGLSSDEIRFDALMTKGYSLTTSSLNSFKVSAFLDDEAFTEFMMEQDVILYGSDWAYSPIKYWPNDEKETVSFFAYSKSLDSGDMTVPVIEKDDHGFFKQKFNYSLPVSTDNTDAQIQPDLVFAQKAEHSRHDGPVSLKFFHALSSIRFKVGEVPANANTTLESIEFLNVCRSADCTILGTPANNLTYSWESVSNGSFKQTYSSLLLKNGLDISSDATFMMIPQTFNTDADMDKMLRITVKVDGEERKGEWYLKDMDSYWLPGEIHTYTISLE